MKGYCILDLNLIGKWLDSFYLLFYREQQIRDKAEVGVEESVIEAMGMRLPQYFRDLLETTGLETG